MSFDMTKCLPYYAWYLRLRKVQTSWMNFTFRRTKGLRWGGVGGEPHFPALEPEPWSVHSRHQCNNDTLILT